MIRSPSTHPDITKDPRTLQFLLSLPTDGRTREIRMSPTLCVARQLHIVVDETTFLSFRGQVHVRPFIRKKLCLFPKEKEKEPLKKLIGGSSSAAISKWPTPASSFAVYTSYYMIVRYRLTNVKPPPHFCAGGSGSKEGASGRCSPEILARECDETTGWREKKKKKKKKKKRMSTWPLLVRI